MTGGEIGIIATQFFVGVGTIGVALVAGVTIFHARTMHKDNVRETRDLQRALRRERQLDKVAEWATDLLTVVNKNWVPSPPSMARYELVAEWKVAFKEWILSTYGNTSREFDVVAARGTYISNIAEAIDTDLKAKVEEAISTAVSLSADIRNRVETEKYPYLDEEAWKLTYTAGEQVIQRVVDLMVAVDTS